MADPDYATHAQPRPAQFGHAPMRFSAATVAALWLATVLILVVGFFVFIEMKQSETTTGASNAQTEAASLSVRIVADEARLSALESFRASNGATVESALRQAESDLAALSTRVTKLESAPDPQLTARLDDLNRQISLLHDALEKRVATLERITLNSSLPQRMDAISSAQSALDARLARLERSEPEARLRKLAAASALADLVRSSSGSEPFVTELQTVRAYLPDASEAIELAPIAKHGAPSFAELKARFPDVAAEALAAEKRSHATSWLARLWNNLTNVVIVRRIGPANGQDSESILARAGSKLNGGDLAASSVELHSLRGAARTTLQPWLNAAQDRLTIERTNAKLSNRLTMLLAPP